MKSIIILILLIGAAMSQSTLTADTATQWQWSSMSPPTGSAYNLTIVYSIGATTGATTEVAASGEEIGLVCIVTTSNFTLADGATGQVGWAMTTTATADGAATIAAIANWGTLMVYPLTTVTHNTDILLTTGATATACTTGTVTASVTSEQVWWLFTITATCANIPVYGATEWYGRCFHKTKSSSLVSASGNALAVSAAKNVTIGASTFAAGATILAAIAYLQF
jgi:hypothetical protein